MKLREWKTFLRGNFFLPNSLSTGDLDIKNILFFRKNFFQPAFSWDELQVLLSWRSDFFFPSWIYFQFSNPFLNERWEILLEAFLSVEILGKLLVFWELLPWNNTLKIRLFGCVFSLQECGMGGWRRTLDQGWKWDLCSKFITYKYNR